MYLEDDAIFEAYDGDKSQAYHLLHSHVISDLLTLYFAVWSAHLLFKVEMV